MKKGWKLFWWISLGSLLLGCIFLIIAFMTGVSVEQLNKHGNVHFQLPKEGVILTEDTTQRYVGVQRIEVDVALGEVEVLPGQGEELEVVTMGIPEELEVYTRQEEDTLVVHSRLKKGKISLPAVSLGKKNFSGKVQIRIPKEKKLESIEGSVDMGVFKIRELDVQEISMEVGVGRAELDRVNIEKTLEIDCELGEVLANIKGEEETFGYSLSCDLGEIVYGGKVFSGISEEVEWGLEKEKKISANCEVGRIKIQFLP